MAADSPAAGGARGAGDLGDVVIDGVSLCLSPLCAALAEDCLAGQVDRTQNIYASVCGRADGCGRVGWAGR